MMFPFRFPFFFPFFWRVHLDFNTLSAPMHFTFFPSTLRSSPQAIVTFCLLDTGEGCLYVAYNFGK